MINKKSVLVLAMLAANAATASSTPNKFGEPITASVTVSKPHGALAAGSKKPVTLMAVQLTDAQKKGILATHSKAPITFKSSELPSEVNVGMNDVPVLDQGPHGTCVTFAVTAAMDAALGKGDYISQLCQLELGSYLQYKGYFLSGWMGSWAPQVFDQMLRFGIVNGDTQHTVGCAGVKDYPVKSFNSGNLMSLKEYRLLSEDISYNVRVRPYMEIYDRFEEAFSNTESAQLALDNIKNALYKGNRVVFGTLLVMVPNCDAGACVSYKSKNDTWAFTDQVADGFAEGSVAAHEMVITGYDDNAVVTDTNGKVHQGLIKLRNSWGDNVGDEGNYYMTYEYFIQLAAEANEVVPMQFDLG